MTHQTSTTKATTKAIAGPTQRPCPLVLGCDVAKATITIHNSRTGQTCDIANQGSRLRQVLKPLQGMDCLIICEASGGYEASLLSLCLDLGLPCHRANAVRVKAFIKSLGIHGKSDHIDARALSLFGQERHNRLQRFQPPSRAAQELSALACRREQLVGLRTMETNRSQAPGCRTAIASCRVILRALQRQIAAIETRIERLIHQTKDFADRYQVLIAIPGIGPQTARALLAWMPELGTLTRRQIASLAGLAPHPRESGSVSAARHTGPGRQSVRRTLFLAGLSASRYNKQITPLYQRMVEKGKAPKNAITACARKLLTIANAKIRDEIVLAKQS